MSVGSIEPKFYAELLAGLGLDAATLPKQNDVKRWPELRERLAAAFKSKTRDEWAAIFEPRDACVAPVLTFTEARSHAHMAARGIYTTVGGVEQPAPAPRFSRTPGAVRNAPPERGQGGAAALADWGFDAAGIAALRARGLGLAD
jgi:alpha-methylacyl-CoA racemase